MQEAAAILGSQNRTQGRSEVLTHSNQEKAPTGWKQLTVSLSAVLRA